MKAILTLLIAVMVFIIALALGAQNDQLVSVNYLIAQSELRLSSLMAVCFFFGVIVMAVFSTLLAMRSKWKALRQSHKTSHADKDS
ncbi:Lipopolysaccharide assembly protein [Saliniradius amylolyticus]|uniref:Probable lipopolysaccharide assembly protein A n=1 Tax=Saliniradius amylolyticus TaxID=2183582 RepID=A0A2S2E2Z5_9ALTE|nr:lipopolysaccharide assembly protein LapA domain-containing protein [Saliniradius amylolyticus]AWL12036.1 Lipopolysaccharide assembly protein [Saliniradius amylolyticus]